MDSAKLNELQDAMEHMVSSLAIVVVQVARQNASENPEFNDVDLIADRYMEQCNMDLQVAVQDLLNTTK